MKICHGILYAVMDADDMICTGIQQRTEKISWQVTQNTSQSFNRTIEGDDGFLSFDNTFKGVIEPCFGLFTSFLNLGKVEEIAILSAMHQLVKMLDVGR
jgi:hypothetical protein